MSSGLALGSIVGIAGALMYMKARSNGGSSGSLVKMKTCKSGKCESMSVIDTSDKDRAARQLMKIYIAVRPVYDTLRKRPGFVDRGPLKVNDILESDGYLTSDEKTTYLYDKNSMYVCLRDAQGNIYATDDDVSALDNNNSMNGNLNQIIYVVLHELTHKLTQSWNHTPIFWKNFEVVLKEAIAQGVYSPDDFSRSPWTHCGKKYVNRGGL